ncbi:hypothetical protein V6N12_064616 [Hibiscus sabdariffa]|uniref:Uncharacterized protein n=1 Tax=Hibiscus sabdariffa TaxID=183260 RepID=A0ABR2G6B3_9ROSI
MMSAVVVLGTDESLDKGKEVALATDSPPDCELPGELVISIINVALSDVVATLLSGSTGRLSNARELPVTT